MMIRFALAAALVVLLRLESLGGTMTFSPTLKIDDRSMWDGGPGATFVIDAKVGASWNVGGTVGGFTTGAFGEKYGLQISGSTSGQAGVSFAMKATSGDLDFTVPVKITLDVPDVVRPGQQAMISARADLLPGFGFDTVSPQLGFKAGVYFQMTAAAGAEACVFGACGSMPTQTLINTPLIDQEVLAVNLGPGPAQTAAMDGKIRVFGAENLGPINFTDFVTQKMGQEVTLFKSVAQQPILTAQYGSAGQTQLIPSIQTTSTLNAQNIATAVRSTDLMTVRLDLGQAAVHFANLAGFPIPPPAGDLQGLLELQGTAGDIASKISYELFTARVGATLGFQQNFEMSRPTFSIDLDFGGGLKQTVYAGLGLTVDNAFSVPTALYGSPNLTVTPTINLNTFDFTNRTSMFIDPIGEFSALSLGLGDLQLGPLWEDSDRIETPRIPLFQKTFQIPGTSKTESAFALAINSDPVLTNGDFLRLKLGKDGAHYNEILTFNRAFAPGYLFDVNARQVSVLDQTTLNINPGGELLFTPSSAIHLAGGSVIRSEHFSLDFFSNSINAGRSKIEVSNGTIDGLKLVDANLDMPIIEVLDGGVFNLKNSSLRREAAGGGMEGATINNRGLLTLENSSVFEINGGDVRALGWEDVQNITTTGNVTVSPGASLFLHGTANLHSILMEDGSFLDVVGNLNGVPVGASGAVLNMGAGSLLSMYAGSNLAGFAAVARLDGDLSALGGTVSNSTLWLNRMDVQGNFTLQDSMVILNGGDIQPGAELRMNNSDMALIKTLTVHENGRLLLTNGSSVFQGGTIDNSGVLESSGGATITGTINNAAGGRVDILNGDLWVSRLVNSGDINVPAGSVLTISSPRGGPNFILENGTVNLAGDLSLLGGNVLEIKGGTLHTTGFSRIYGSVDNQAGTVHVDNAEHLRVFGDYVQGSAGLLWIELANPGNAAFNIFGQAWLDGLLRVSLGPFDYDPGKNGTRFSAITFAGRHGQFSAYDILGVLAGYAWDIDYTDFDVGFILRLLPPPGSPDLSKLPKGTAPRQLPGPPLVDISNNLPSPYPPPPPPPPLGDAPEPATWLLMAAGIAGLALKARRS